MKSSLAFVALAALAISGCQKKAADGTPASPTTPVAAVPAPAGKSWVDVVSPTPEGGMRMGNPDAKVKFVEYASFTCPHCAKFEADAAEELKLNYVSTGKVSWEFRSFIIHGPDMPITLMMNCRGPDAYFVISQQLYATQMEWLGKLEKLTPDEQQQIQGLSPIGQFKRMTDLMGLYGFMAARGMPKAQVETCLSSQSAIDAVTAHQTRYQNEDQINGTPTFFINGQQQNEVNDWAKLEPRLRAAIG